jgi:uncharacterized 2Fe-2S/4Fe-4S cluster protein (DUF4445 family)
VIGDQPLPVAEVRSGGFRRPVVIGRKIFDYADDLAIQMPASCERSGRCHECVVEVLDGADVLSPPTEPETFLRSPFRLACQAEIESDDRSIEFRPLRRRLRITLAHDDPDRRDGLDPIESPVRRADGVVTYAGEPLDVDRGRALGMAIDVGTTTVVVELVDLESGSILGVGAFENPQGFGGSDVMNRISYDGHAPGELRHALSRALNQEIRALCRQAGVDRRVIYEAMVVGNATMRDCFFGIDLEPIGQRPYKSAVELEALAGVRPTTVLRERAHRLGLWMHPQGWVVSGPLIASHVGADVAADLVALDADQLTGRWMLVDIGTNTEIVMSDGTRILAASCPAGPAFEGGLVRYGMPGSDGAIERVRLEGDAWQIETIGDVPAEGICGSGLIDLLAELRRNGRMTQLGVFGDRVGQIIVNADRGITLSREDASNLAQAKAANACGQAILLRHLGLDASDLERVFLAGGFADHVDVENAIAIGFLAEVRPDRVSKVGNASIRGARRMLLSLARRKGLDAIVTRIEHVELEMTADFFELFVEACQFKPLAAA